MHYSALVLAAFASSAHAFAWPQQAESITDLLNGLFGRNKPRGQCPAVWSQISDDLNGMFVAGGQCTDDARAAIRAVFHDCFPAGGCDGSLALPEELSRPDNAPMTGTVNKLAALAKQHNVGVADMLMFAGSHAVVSCPGGPRTQTYIGRQDATSPAPDGQLPKADVGGDQALAAFKSKGFSAQDLGALIGAHTASRQFVTEPSKSGAPQDSTPGIWDVLYYIQTIAGKAPFSFQADRNLAQQKEVGPTMKRFQFDILGWNNAFASAMAKMELLGTKDKGTLVDCTSALPRGRLFKSRRS